MTLLPNRAGSQALPRPQMDTEQLEVRRKGEEILERAYEGARKLEERTWELMHDGPPERDGRDNGVSTDEA